MSTPMPSNCQETERIQRVYTDYAIKGFGNSKWSLSNPGNRAMYQERSRVLAKMLARAQLMPLANKRLLEIGCGEGRVLRELIALGAKPSDLSAVDLMAERVEAARAALPEVDLRVADARSLPFDSAWFDLVLVFTVFSSILDPQTADQVAREIARVLKPGGAVVTYDFQYNNPNNTHVRGIKSRQWEQWFPDYRCQWKSLTVLPPLVRRLGGLAQLAYPCLAVLPFLRTHILGVLTKPAPVPALNDWPVPGWTDSEALST